jgi:hypothetical protein
MSCSLSRIFAACACDSRPRQSIVLDEAGPAMSGAHSSCDGESTESNSASRLDNQAKVQTTDGPQLYYVCMHLDTRSHRPLMAYTGNIDPIFSQTTACAISSQPELYFKPLRSLLPRPATTPWIPTPPKVLTRVASRLAVSPGPCSDTIGLYIDLFHGNIIFVLLLKI